MREGTTPVTEEAELNASRSARYILGSFSTIARHEAR